MGTMIGTGRKVKYGGKVYRHSGNSDMWDDVREDITDVRGKVYSSRDFLIVSDGYSGFDIYSRGGHGIVIRASIDAFVRANPQYKKRYKEAREEARE